MGNLFRQWYLSARWPRHRKDGIWMLTFPDRENTGNLANLVFYTGKIGATWKILKIYYFFENFAI